MKTTVIIISIFVVLSAIIVFLSCQITEWIMKVDYAKGYKKLPYLNLRRYKDQVFDENSQFVWFLDNNEFKINSGEYINNAFSTWIVPRSAKWMKKYRNYMKEHHQHFMEDWQIENLQGKINS